MSLSENNDASTFVGVPRPWLSYDPKTGDVIGTDGMLYLKRARSSPTPAEKLRGYWPAEHRAHFDRLVESLFPGGTIPATIVEDVLERIRCSTRVSSGTWWRGLLLRAVRDDALELGEKQRRTCGALTWELRKKDGTSQLIRFTCKSERCRHCAKRACLTQQKRLTQQLVADGSGARGMPVFITITWDLRQISREYGVSQDEARTLSWSLSRRARARFMELLRGKSVNGSRSGDYPDLEYYGRTELTGKQTPHYHFVVLSKSLTADMMRGYSDYQTFFDEHMRRLGPDNKLKRGKKLIYSHIRSKMNRFAKLAGFGTSFDMSPVSPSNLEKVSSYLTKEPRLSKELAKTRQTSGLVRPMIPRNARLKDVSRGFWTVPHPNAGNSRSLGNLPPILHLTDLDTLKSWASNAGIRETISECTCDGAHDDSNRHCRVGLPSVELAADMRTGEHPAPGERWPRTVVCVGLVGTIRPMDRDLLNTGEPLASLEKLKQEGVHERAFDR